MGILFWLGVLCLQLCSWCLQLAVLMGQVLFVVLQGVACALVWLVRLTWPLLLAVLGIALAVILLGAVLPLVAVVLCVVGVVAPKNNRT